jgi:hypothetical protein
MVPNTAPIIQFTLWELVVPHIYNVITASHIQASIFNWTYLRCYPRHLDNSMRFVLQTWCQIWRTSSSLRNVNCGPGHIQCNYSSTYSGSNIQQNVAPLLLEICRQFGERNTATLVAILRTASSLRRVNCGPGHIQCIHSSAYTDINIQLNVPALLLDICRDLDARYTANSVPNTALVIQFTQCVLWSRTYTKNLQLRIFRLQYSAIGICAAIVDIRTFRSPFDCKLRSKYSAHPPVYAM